LVILQKTPWLLKFKPADQRIQKSAAKITKEFPKAAACRIKRIFENTISSVFGNQIICIATSGISKHPQKRRFSIHFKYPRTYEKKITESVVQKLLI
jgi:hypothetical protein